MNMIGDAMIMNMYEMKRWSQVTKPENIHQLHQEVEQTKIERFGLIHFTSCQHDIGYIYGRSQIQVYTDERTQVHSAQSSLVVGHPSKY